MIAKDFILQISALSKDPLWVECHERMARWFVMMNHYMTTEEDFGAGHAQQNEEQLNNLFKTLKGYYASVALRQAYPNCIRNQGAFPSPCPRPLLAFSLTPHPIYNLHFLPPDSLAIKASFWGTSSSCS